MNTEHNLYKIRNIDVLFPYNAYPNQLLYMEKVIQSLQEEKNALLESPTGTGKTICLLCSTLAWRENYIKITETNKDDAPTIIYATRTHSQINQVYREFTKTAYFDKVIACTIGSRKYYCVNPAVSIKAYEARNPELPMSNQIHRIGINTHCHSLVKKRKCGFYNKVKVSKKDYQNPIDIEDLFNDGLKSGTCTYFYLKESSKFADIIFMPYNYVIDPYIRKSLEINLKNSILIIDEAHNLDSVSSESCSFDISTYELTSAVTEINELLDAFEFSSSSSIDISQNIIQDDINLLLLFASNLAKKITILSDEIMNIQLINEKYTSDCNTLISIFNKCHFQYQHGEQILENIQNLIHIFTLDDNEYLSFNKPVYFNNLTRFVEALERYFTFDLSNPQISSAFKMNIQSEQKTILSANQFHKKTINCRRLYLWCFDPGLAMKGIANSGIRNMILTSGTLSPLNSMESELSLSFPIKLENLHIVDQSQVWVGIVSKAIDGSILTSSYNNRNREYMINLGLSISELISVIPDGVLVFFPSYSLLEATVDVWKNFYIQDMSLLDFISNRKRVVFEPKDPSKLKSTMDEHYNNIVKGYGSIFFAVCRGKVSEGLDFSDRNGRAVIIVGIPYPLYKDVKVILKRNYLDENKNKHLSGTAWYNQSAWRAVNQSIGRVIRHKNDYGAIIFLDDRFNRQYNELSKWLQGYVKYMEDLNMSLVSLKSFYLSMKHLDKFNEEKSIVDGEVKINRIKEVKVDWSQVYEKLKNDSENMFKIKRQNSSFSPIINNDNHVVIKSNLTADSNSFKIHTNTNNNVMPNNFREGMYNNFSPFNDSNKQFIDVEMELNKPQRNNESTQPQSITNDNQEPKNNDLKSPKANKAKEFIDKAKRELSSSEYKSFQKYMISFKKGEISKSILCESILKLLDGKEELLESFSEFIPKFLSKRKNEENKESCPIKKQKVKEEENDKTHNLEISKVNPNPPKSPSRTSRTPDWIKTRHKLTIKNYFQSKERDGNENKPIDLEDDRNEVKSKNEEKSPLEHKKVSPTKKIFNNLITGQKSKRVIPSVLILDKEEEEDSITSSPSDDICTVCYSKYKDPCKLKCEHIFCYECINNWIKVKLECPICRKRIRVKHIQRLNV